MTAQIDQASATRDPEKRKALYVTISKRIVDQLYWLPLWVEATTYAYNKDLNFQPSSDEDPRFFLSSWK